MSQNEPFEILSSFNIFRQNLFIFFYVRVYVCVPQLLFWLKFFYNLWTTQRSHTTDGHFVATAHLSAWSSSIYIVYTVL